MSTTPTPPPGYTLDAAAPPTPPPGYTLDQPSHQSFDPNQPPPVGPPAQFKALDAQLKQHGSDLEDAKAADTQLDSLANPPAKGFVQSFKDTISGFDPRNIVENEVEHYQHFQPSINPSQQDFSSVAPAPQIVRQAINDPAGAAGTATGMAAGTAAYGAAGKVIGKVAPAIVHPMETLTGINNVPPEQLVMKSLRGSVPTGKSKFLPNLSTSMPEIKAAEAQLGKPVEGIDDLLGTEQQPGAIRMAKRNLIGQYNQMLNSQGQIGKQIDLSPVADAMDRSVSRKTRLENPQVAKNISLIANRYRQMFPIEHVDDLLHDANAELNSYYLKNPVAQRVAAATNPDTAMLDAQVKQMRNALYGALDDPGQGAAAREIMRRYGTLTELEDAMYRRRNVALRQAPLDLSQNISRWESVGDMARAAAKFATGQVGSGAADLMSGIAKRNVAKWLSEQQATDALIKRGFANHAGKPMPIQMPPAVTPAGLLGPASIQMPGVPNPSGPVPGGPYMGRGMSPNIGTRTLGPGPRVTSMPGVPDQSGSIPGGPYPGRGMSPQAGNRTLPPASMHQSGGFATGTTNDLVPVKHPVTGEIEYVPQWTQQPPPPDVLNSLPPGTHTFRNGAVVHKDAGGKATVVKPPQVPPQ